MIDFVVTWVDGSDERWLSQKNKYMSEYDLKLNSSARYRDWGFLKYWFRSVELHAPWVNKIYFITEGHIPDWLDTTHSKLVIVKHSDYIDNKYLPTFNSNVIEMNIHNIDGLADCFVLFNDDMFLNNNVDPSDFFENNLPKDIGVLSPIIPTSNSIDSIVLNNVAIINDYFDKRRVLKTHLFKFFNLKYRNQLTKNICMLPWKKFTGFYDNHIPISYTKKSFEQIWNLNLNLLHQTLNHKFRTKTDINHWLIRYWQICSGEFVPRSITFGKYYDLGVNQEELLNDIRKRIHKVICLNDNEIVEEFNKIQSSIINELERKYKYKSAYEK